MTFVAPKTIYAYRIFHIDNLKGIINNNGQYSRTQMLSKDISYRDISNGEIQDRRAGFNVPLSPYGYLHDYVPFYFSNRSPMLYACHSGTVPGYNYGQDPIIYLVTSVQKLHQDNVDFLFTDGHASMQGSNYYNNTSDLSNVNWDIIDSWSWGNTVQDQSRKQKKQAELLVNDFVPLHSFLEIGVKNKAIKAEVMRTLSANNVSLPVSVKTNWYY